MHGPFTTKRERDDAIARLQSRETCPCERCERLPDADKPRSAPQNLMRMKGKEGSYWIANMAVGRYS